MKKQEFRRKAPRCAPFDYKGVEDELTEMAQAGWQIEQIDDRNAWIYRKTEPAEKQFAAVFCKKTRYLRYEEDESQKRLEDFCQSNGWHKVGQWHKMVIFSADKGVLIPPETDETVRLKSAREAMRNSVIMYSVFALAAMILCLTNTADILHVVRTGGEWYTALGNYAIIMILLSVFIYCIIWLAGYKMWLKRMEENILSGRKTTAAAKTGMASFLAYKVYKWTPAVLFIGSMLALMIMQAVWNM